jgi:hypothetical protein
MESAWTTVFLRVLKNSLVTRFIGQFSYENLSGQGTFSTLSFFIVPACDVFEG